MIVYVCRQECHMGVWTAGIMLYVFGLDLLGGSLVWA